MWIDKHAWIRAMAIAVALLLGAMEAMALQKARVTRWRLNQRGY